MSKLEIYGIAIAAFIVITIGSFFGGYASGRLAESHAQTKAAQAESATQLKDYADLMHTRSADDAQAHQRTVDLLAALNKGLDDVHTKFGALVADVDGCQRVTDAARLRWNATESLSTGQSAPSTSGGAGKPVPAQRVPAPR